MLDVGFRVLFTRRKSSEPVENPAWQCFTLEEYQRGASHKFSIESILWIATPNEPDVAYLRLKRSPTNRRFPSRISPGEETPVGYRRVSLAERFGLG